MTHRQMSAERSARAAETVAVLGAGGTMGFAMARNIAPSGLPVQVWNRSRDKAEPLAQDGAVVTGTPGEAAEGAAIVLAPDRDAIFLSTETCYQPRVLYFVIVISGDWIG